MKKILICGYNSYAAKDLSEILLNYGFEVDCFSRGEEARIGNKITGNVFNILDNKYLDERYDIVINFIIIKDSNIDENIKYIKSLDRFCAERGINRLLQISSISVYSNDLKYVNEESEIEYDPITKGGYASIKIAVDQFLLKNKI